MHRTALFLVVPLAVHASARQLASPPASTRRQHGGQRGRRPRMQCGWAGKGGGGLYLPCPPAEPGAPGSAASAPGRGAQSARSGRLSAGAIAAPGSGEKGEPPEPPWGRLSTWALNSSTERHRRGRRRAPRPWAREGRAAPPTRLATRLCGRPAQRPPQAGTRPAGGGRAEGWEWPRFPGGPAVREAALLPGAAGNCSLGACRARRCSAGWRRAGRGRWVPGSLRGGGFAARARGEALLLSFLGRGAEGAALCAASERRSSHSVLAGPRSPLARVSSAGSLRLLPLRRI